LPETLKSGILLDDFSEISLGSLEMTNTLDRVKRSPVLTNFAVTHVPKEDDLAAILYTSGTTGTPKGVMLSHKNIISNAISTLGIQKVDTSDRLLSVLPLPHTYECTIGFIIPFMTGATVYYLDKLPTPAVLLPAMAAVKPTMMLTVPLIIEKVYQNRVRPKLTGSPLMRTLTKFKPMRKFFHKVAGKKIYKAFGGSLHFFGVGGAKLDASTELFLRDAGFPYAIGYGLTETSPLLAGCSPKITKYRSTGFNLPNQEIMISNPDAETGEGEILAKGPNIMMGYYKEPEITKEVFTDDGWFKTGDLGVMDSDGYLFIKGRLKNIIISATGENIYPEDIEAVINSEHNVLESLVYEMKGKLVAKVHLNYDEIDQRYQHLKSMADQNYSELKESAGQSYQDLKDSAGQSINELKESAAQMYDQVQEKVKLRLAEIQEKVNARLNRFSKLAVMEEQPEPFEKTPTKKIKRFLYYQQHRDHSK
jgi:long-chain acyl-CoA synthetase